MSKRDETSDLLARLKRHYIKPGQPLPGGMFLPEVGMNGSWGASRRCDAIYVGFTSSSGRLLVGHELKVTRADWLKELEDREKADAWADHCHEWWLVTGPDIVQDGELPAGWGHMVPGKSRTRMKVLQKPVRHLERQPSWDVVRSVMSRADTLRAQDQEQMRQKAREDARQDIQDEVERRVAMETGGGRTERLQTQLEKKRALVEEICEALGVEEISNDRRFGRVDSVAHVDDLRPLAQLITGVGQADQVRDLLNNRYVSAEAILREALEGVEKAQKLLGSAGG